MLDTCGIPLSKSGSVSLSAFVSASSASSHGPQALAQAGGGNRAAYLRSDHHRPAQWKHCCLATAGSAAEPAAPPTAFLTYIELVNVAQCAHLKVWVTRDSRKRSGNTANVHATTQLEIKGGVTERHATNTSFQVPLQKAQLAFPPVESETSPPVSSKGASPTVGSAQ